MNRRIIQIVRRFGPVGGMEEYAWQLTCALAKTGHPVEVLCEVDDSNGDLDVPVTFLACLCRIISVVGRFSQKG